jgi:drug/metabolite transporter (DMT)-like permease
MFWQAAPGPAFRTGAARLQGDRGRRPGPSGGTGRSVHADLRRRERRGESTAWWPCSAGGRREDAAASWPSLPPLLFGVVLAGGVLESGVGGSDPVLGMVHAVLAALCYSGYLFLLRRNSGEGRTLRAYLLVTVSAGTCSLVVGSWWHGVELAPGWAAVGWLALVALFGQVLGWLLVALAGPRLPSHVGAILLLFTPVGAVALGALVLSERPTPLQLSGCVLILASACMAAMGHRGDRES